METDSLNFDQIYEELFPVLYRFVSARIPVNDVEDVTSDIMSKVWRALPGFTGQGSLKSWATSIAYHQIADYYRGRKKISLIPLNEELKQTNDHTEEWTTLMSVNQALAKMPAQHVTVIQLRLIEGFSAAEVARVLGITQQAVDSLLYRAKKSFRKFYELEGIGGIRQ